MTQAHTEQLRRSPASGIAINLAVISAILLRDIRLRAGPYYVGFLIVLLLPLGHLIVLLIAFQIFHKVPPVGNDPIIYFGLSILPFVVYLYLSRRIILSVIENKPLLYFYRVKMFDIFAARGILEGGNTIAVFLVLLAVLLIFSNGVHPRDPAGIVFAVAGTIYMSFSLGALNGLICQLAPPWVWGYALLMPMMWLGSGVVFFPSAIPEPYAHWLSFNPLLQCVEWLRYSYYDDYPDQLLSPAYLVFFSTTCLAGAMIGEKLGRRSLR